MLNSKCKKMFPVAVVLALIGIDAAVAQTYYGSQLMSPQEGAEHRMIMRQLSPSEREAYRAQHHETMKQRAESMGLALPDEPPAHGRSVVPRGPGYGYGAGRPGWAPGYGGAGPRYRRPPYGGWRHRVHPAAGYGHWGPRAW
mgnify:CR=1 FL=1